MWAWVMWFKNNWSNNIDSYFVLKIWSNAHTCTLKSDQELHHFKAGSLALSTARDVDP